MKNSIYDIIIIGAGPAGLTAARLLAKSGLKILLIEKEVIGKRPRSWITWYNDLVSLGYEETIINKINSITFRSFLGGEYRYNSTSSAIVNTSKLLLLLKQQAKNASVTIHEKETFLRYKQDGTKIVIETDIDSYEAKYCIDASGSDSIIQRGLSGPISNSGLMGCYAYEVEKLKINDTTNAYIFDAALPGKNYFWFMPYSNSKALIGCFFFRKLDEQRAIKAISKYLKLQKIKGKIKAIIKGNIPLISRQSMSYGRIFMLGDAVSSPIPSSGYGLLKAIQEAEILAKELKKGFTSGKINYEQEILDNRFPGFELHYLVSDILRNINDPLLNKAITRMNKTDITFLRHFLRGDDLSLNFSAQAITAIFETFTMQEIASMTLDRDYKDFLLRIARVYPRVTPGVIKKAIKSFLPKFLFKA